MFRFLTSLLATDPTSARTAGHAPKARLGFELVEDRCTPGGGIWTDDPAPVAVNPTQIGQPAPVAPGGTVTLNPQPLPPGGTVGLNPQPLPPGGIVPNCPGGCM